MEAAAFWVKHRGELKKLFPNKMSFCVWIGHRPQIDLNDYFALEDVEFARKLYLQKQHGILKKKESLQMLRNKRKEQVEKEFFICGKCSKRNFRGELTTKIIKHNGDRTGYSSKDGWFCSAHDADYLAAAAGKR